MVPKESVITITQKPNSVRQGSLTFYQFGRKDPFPGTNGAPKEGTFNQLAGNYMSISNGIQHPESFYTDGTSWYSAPPTGYTWINLWSADNKELSNWWNDNTVVKTIYDPCPAGFRLPVSNAFSIFENSVGKANVADVGWTGGWNFNNKYTNPDASVYFLGWGYRDHGNGSMHYTGLNGYYWSASPYGAVDACTLYFSFHRTASPFAHESRSIGASVHPVAEPKTGITPKTPGSSVEAWQEEELDGGHGRQQ